jgi:hypothetical protein
VHDYWCMEADGGTGSARGCLSPMLAAWADTQEKHLEPGTVNLRADRPVELPAKFISLVGWATYLHPGVAWRAEAPGFSPRLYPVRLNDSIPAFLFRWSADPGECPFVGSTQACPASHRCEIVADRYLRGELGLDAGNAVRLTIQ